MIFADTWAWLALAYHKDPYHSAAARQHQLYRQQRQRYATTDYVLSEFITLPFRVSDFATARQFVENLLLSLRSGRHQFVDVSADQFDRAWRMRQTYRDKPDISFVDFTSMVVMQDLGITEIFTGDHHFEQVGLGFQLKP